MQALLGTDKLIRDFTTFTTERDEAATLALYVTGARQYSSQCNAVPSCPCDVFGQVSLEGTYFVALVIGDRFINAAPLDLSNHMFPLTANHAANRRIWGQEEAYADNDPRNAEVEPVKLIKLADFNGDGHAWEFRLVQYEACGHLDTLIAGYSPRQRQAILYPIIKGEERTYWSDNLFPHPDEATRAGRLRTQWICGDHGNDEQTVEEYAYDAAREAWVRTRRETRDCDAVDGRSDGSAETPQAFFHIAGNAEHATAVAGDRTTLDVSFQTKRSDLRVVMADMMLDPPLTILRNADGHPSCSAGAETQTVTQGERAASFWFNPPRCISPDAPCQPATEVGTAIPLGLEGSGERLLYRCDVQIPDGTLPGLYPAWISRVRVYDNNNQPVPVNGTDGFVAVGRSIRK